MDCDFVLGIDPGPEAELDLDHSCTGYILPLAGWASKPLAYIVIGQACCRTRGSLRIEAGHARAVSRAAQDCHKIGCQES